MFINPNLFALSMTVITIELPDGTKKQHPKGVTGIQIAQSIGARLARDAVAIKVNNELYDLFRPIEQDAKIMILTFDQKEGKSAFWHSTAHVLAQAVLSLFPDAKPTIGPPIDEGFYYDFDVKKPFAADDLEKIEKKMEEIVKSDYSISRAVVSIKDAKKQFKHNKYKLELIDDFSQQSETVSVYSQGDFSDLCRGGHVPNTGRIGAFKLLKTSSAYWRGDQKRESLQRIYGISFPTVKQLKDHLHMLEEAEKRDHRKIGTALDLFSFQDVSPGSPFFHPKGTFIFNTLTNFLRIEYVKRGYQEVITPQLFHKELWEISGHWAHYKQNMFLTTMDGQEASIKPMNCPTHVLIYKTTVRSYRELPLRFADFGALHRNEVRGTLGGLFRVRKLHQDDAHIFCAEEHIEPEIHKLIDFIRFLYQSTFGFQFTVELSTKPAGALGSEELWTKAENSLKSALDHAALKFNINPGDGAFYGPKIDFHIKDALGRSWQCATIQLDFNFPERFNLEFDGSDGKRHRPVMIHRALFGSLERFIGILIEHYAGRFPLWLNPNQVALLPIADRHADYCKEVVSMLRGEGLRADVNESAETTGKKIRDAQVAQYSYLLIVGDVEMKNKTVNVRTRDEKVHGEKSVDVLLKELIAEIKNRK